MIRVTGGRYSPSQLPTPSLVTSILIPIPRIHMRRKIVESEGGHCHFNQHHLSISAELPFTGGLANPIFPNTLSLGKPWSMSMPLLWVPVSQANGPIRRSPPTFMGLWHISDHIATRFASSFSPSIMSTTGYWNTFLQRSTVGRWMMKTYWCFATGLASQYAKFSDSAHTEHLRPWPHADGYPNSPNGRFWTQKPTKRWMNCCLSCGAPHSSR